MDYFRGFMSNSLDIALQILQKKIKTGEDQDPFRAHTNRDIDDSISNIIAQFAGNNNNNSDRKPLAHPVDFAFMILAGERASRINRDSVDELTNSQTQGFINNLEQFMCLRRPAEEPAMTPEGYATSKKGSKNNNNRANDDDANASAGNQDGNNNNNENW